MARKGVFEEAAGGTLLIDEIGDLPLHLQPKLLRAIDRQEVRPVGTSGKLQKVDARILVATRRDLDQEVLAGRFRDDLFHRLAVGRVELPPLREREGDVTLMAKAFWEAAPGATGELPSDVLWRWDSRPWPGNIRELRNAVLRYAALGELAEGVAADPRSGTRAENADARPLQGGQALAAQGRDWQAWLEALADQPLAEARKSLNDAFERIYVEQVLRRHDGNVTHAAAHAGIARRYLQVLKKRSSPGVEGAGCP